MKMTFVQKLKGKIMTERKTIFLDDALEAIRKLPNVGIHWFVSAEAVFDALLKLPLAEPEITKEYNLKKIYNIYVKIAQAHFVYQPSKPKVITAMPFDWLEVQNLLEEYLEDHGADFDALCKEYVSENVKDNHLPSAEPEPTERTYKRGYADGYSKAEKDYFERTEKGRADAFKMGVEIGRKRKRGKWIEHEWAEEVGGMLVSNYECSECLCWKREASDFCPNCGSEMRGGESECVME